MDGRETDALCDRFFQYMDDQVHTNLRAANLTGVPSVLHTVQAFLNLPAWRDSILINPNIEVCLTRYHCL
jgi:hypothetical protein